MGLYNDFEIKQYGNEKKKKKNPNKNQFKLKPKKKPKSEKAHENRYNQLV
jgi:hypothetical protein